MIEEDRFIRLPHAVAAALKVSPRTVQRWVKAGHLPPPVRLGPKVAGYSLSTLNQIMRGEK